MNKTPAVILIILSASFAVFNSVEFLSEEAITEGYRIFENVRMSSAGNGGISLDEEQAFKVTKFIETKIAGKYFIHLINILFSVVILGVASWLLFSFKKTNNNNQ